ncbi:NADP(H)-dependent aldo-keto reductase [Nitrogeniibacter mangrovi]|uniref:Protein tas n=1 Tax=Nitrogeniibacter mangrovi TaxID=2016596 RepID=A0A6C1B6X1_9RHOO|nr:NADP(H)-dependent aldo-keto reductase [Nitrogeniibacter mangrovi]QID18709.1 NADP(H)-dependent aldo-keto reductase [Nitrogeniibacter mangrovi]
MQYRRLGTSELVVSHVCLGTMTFGQQNTEAEGHAQLDAAFAAGVNFVDVAEMYPVPTRADTYGATERIVGTWLRRQPRDKVILATKIAGPGRALGWIRGGPRAMDASNLREALDGSLKRLQTDYVDLYQLHWPERNQPMFGQTGFDPSAERECTPIRDQLEALAGLVRAGKIRYVGLSNEHPWGVMRFVQLAREHDLPVVVSIQNAYNLLNRVFEYGLSEVCYRENVGLLAYSPLAFGHLSGKYLDQPDAAGRLTLFPHFGQRYEKPAVAAAVAEYAALARAHGLTPTQLALAFVYGRWFVTSTIIGATSLAQLQENLDCADMGMTEALEDAIAEVHARHTNPAP